VPKCQVCQRSVKSNDLQQVGEILACGRCRRPKKLKEDKVAETLYDQAKDRKKVMSFHIFDIPTKDGARDHQVEAEVVVGGLNLQYTTTFDQVREFFTRQRERGQQAKLKAVK